METDIQILQRTILEQQKIIDLLKERLITLARDVDGLYTRDDRRNYGHAFYDAVSKWSW